ncbi:MAG: DUF1566 domain-containing protein, partial [SAR324 cluster bacterium]|nr:DUF1566 domain-containing protein [SAR324 cluster bacterium]
WYDELPEEEKQAIINGNESGNSTPTADGTESASTPASTPASTDTATTDTTTPASTPATPDTTSPTNASVKINSGATSTTSTTVTLNLSATDNVGITGYYTSESSTSPTSSTTWISVTAATSYTADVSFTLSSTLGSKTVYVWFTDVAGNRSTSTRATITLVDGVAPTNPLVSVNGGAAISRETSVRLSLSATDDVGVTGYYASESSATPPAVTDSSWTSVTSSASYTGTGTFTLTSSGEGSKTVYVWFRDSAGNVSIVTSASISYSLGHDRLVWPDTGQTTSYTATFGEDNDYTIRAPSYTDNGNGTITDNITGLVWQKEDDNNTYSWSSAGTYCDNLELGSQTDWRLPHVKELSTLVNAGTYSPSINTTYFPNTNSSNYWSSSADAGSTSYAWYVNFTSGHVGNNSKADSGYVRCVRGGQ